MKKLFFFGFLYGTALAVVGQSPKGSDAQTDLVLIQNGMGMFRSFDNRYKGIDGFPTLFQSYQKGKIKMSAGQIIEIDSINLDIVGNELLVKRNNVETVVNKSMVEEFEVWIQTSWVKFIKKRDMSGRITFFAVLLEGKYNLVRLDNKSLIEPTSTGAYSNGALAPRFDESKKYYLIFNGNLIEIRNRKQFLSLFSDHSEVIDNFIKSEDLTIKSENDLIALVSYINKLV